MAPLVAIGLGLSAAGVIGSTINSLKTPQFPLSQEDIEKMINLQMNRTLTEESAAARRRLSAAGLGGSGVIDQIISDQRSRIRSRFEEERQKAINQLAQFQFQRDIIAQQNRGALFGNISSLGFNIAGLGMKNPFSGYLQQLQGLQQQGGSLQQMQSFPGLEFDPRRASDFNYPKTFEGVTSGTDFTGFA